MAKKGNFYCVCTPDCEPIGVPQLFMSDEDARFVLGGDKTTIVCRIGQKGTLYPLSNLEEEKKSDSFEDFLTFVRSKTLGKRTGLAILIGSLCTLALEIIRILNQFGVI